MLPYKSRLLVGLVASLLITVFITGLAHSISTGFAGFWGGLPFWVIAIIVLSMAWYDFYDSAVRKDDTPKSDQ